MSQSYAWTVGIDLGSKQHQVCILGVGGEAKQEMLLPHKGESVVKLVSKLLDLSKNRPESVAVALEAPRGPVVDVLLAEGFHIYSINPKQLDRFRDRYTVAGAKDDRRDALVLAAALRTDRSAFRRSQVEDDALVELRELSRVQDELREDITRLVNQWQGLLRGYYPQFLEVCPDLDTQWAWALWELAPTPQASKELSEAQIELLLRRFRVRRIKAPQLLELLQAQALEVSSGALQACKSHVELLLPRLKVTCEQWARCEKRIDELQTQLAAKSGDTWARDLEVIRSMPGIGTRVAAMFLAEATDAIQQRDYEALRSLAGTAPVTRQSGKRRQVSMRRACNQRLRNGLYYWMRTYSIRDPYGKRTYQRLRDKGHGHAHALRILADRLLKTLAAMLRDGTTYDAARRQAILTT